MGAVIACASIEWQSDWNRWCKKTLNVRTNIWCCDVGTMGWSASMGCMAQGGTSLCKKRMLTGWPVWQWILRRFLLFLQRTHTRTHPHKNTEHMIHCHNRRPVFHERDNVQEKRGNEWSWLSMIVMQNSTPNPYHCVTLYFESLHLSMIFADHKVLELCRRGTFNSYTNTVRFKLLSIYDGCALSWGFALILRLSVPIVSNAVRTIPASTDTTDTPRVWGSHCERASPHRARKRESERTSERVCEQDAIFAPSLRELLGTSLL